MFYTLWQWGLFIGVPIFVISMFAALYYEPRSLRAHVFSLRALLAGFILVAGPGAWILLAMFALALLLILIVTSTMEYFVRRRKKKNLNDY